MELYWHHLPPKATTAATTSTSSASTPTHMVKKPLPPHATAATSPSGTSTVDISNAELARLCSKLSGKELGRYFKRLRDPQVISPKNNEHKETMNRTPMDKKISGQNPSLLFQKLM